MTGCQGCRYDDHCGRQLDVSRSVGCVEWEAYETPPRMAAQARETCETCRCRGTYSCLLSGNPLPGFCIHWQPMPVTCSAGTGCAPECSHPEHRAEVQPPHPLLALERRLRADAERAGHEAWRHGRGSYECGLRRGEALGLTRAADEIAAIARGEGEG